MINLVGLKMESVKIRMFDGVKRTLNQVSFILDMKRNLMSLGMLNSHGLKWSSKKEVLDIRSRDKIALRGHKHNNPYMLEDNSIYGEVHFTGSWFKISHVWHSRLGHMSDRYIFLLVERRVLPDLGKVDLTFCEHCIMSKQHWRNFGVGTHSSKKLLDYIHSDVWGYSHIASLSGKLYYVSFTHVYSRYVWIYFLTHKSKVFPTFKSWRA